MGVGDGEGEGEDRCRYQLLQHLPRCWTGYLLSSRWTAFPALLSQVPAGLLLERFMDGRQLAIRNLLQIRE